MVDLMRFPGADIVELYSHRREMGDEAQPATTPADPAQQEGCGDTARAVGRAAGVQSAAQPDGKDGSESEGIHGEPAEFSHGIGVPHP